jgi:hypothetical protein
MFMMWVEKHLAAIISYACKLMMWVEKHSADYLESMPKTVYKDGRGSS